MRARGYGDGHIPEAVLLDNNWIRNPKAPPTFLPTPQEFEALMSRLGISNTTRVIAYDERGGIYAARLWWILNHYGHSNVAVLDGGWVKWTAEQRADDDDGAIGRRGDIQGEARNRQGGDRRSGEGGDQQPGVKLIDARTQARDRRQGSAQHQARRLHRVVDARVLGRHARSGRPRRSSPPPRSPGSIATRASPRKTTCWCIARSACARRTTSSRWR